MAEAYSEEDLPHMPSPLLEPAVARPDDWLPAGKADQLSSPEPVQASSAGCSDGLERDCIMDGSLQKHAEDVCMSLGRHDWHPARDPALTVGSGLEGRDLPDLTCMQSLRSPWLVGRQTTHFRTDTSDGAQRRLLCALDSPGDRVLGLHDQHCPQTSVMAAGRRPQIRNETPFHKLDSASKPAGHAQVGLHGTPCALAITRSFDSPVVESDEHHGKQQPAEDVVARLPEQPHSEPLLAISTRSFDSPVVESDEHHGKQQPAEDVVARLPEQPHSEPLLAISTRSSDSPVVNSHKHGGKPQPAEDVAAGLPEQHLSFGPTAAGDTDVSVSRLISEDTPGQPRIAQVADQSTACHGNCDQDVLNLWPSAEQAGLGNQPENLDEEAGLDAEPQNSAAVDCQPRDNPGADPGQQQAPSEAPEAKSYLNHRSRQSAGEQMPTAKLQSLSAWANVKYLTGHSRAITVQSSTLAGASMADSWQDRQQQQHQQPGMPPFIDEPAGLSASSQPRAWADQQLLSAHDACGPRPGTSRRWQHPALSEAKLGSRAEMADKALAAGHRGSSKFVDLLTEHLSHLAGHTGTSQTDQHQQQNTSHLPMDPTCDLNQATGSPFRNKAHMQKQAPKPKDAAAILKQRTAAHQGPSPSSASKEQVIVSCPGSEDTTSTQADAAVAAVCHPTPFVSGSMQSEHEADEPRKGGKSPDLTCMASRPRQRSVRRDMNPFKAAALRHPIRLSRSPWRLHAQLSDSSSPPGQMSGDTTPPSAIGAPRLDQRMQSPSPGLAEPDAAFKAQVPRELSRSIPPSDDAASAIQQLPYLAAMPPDVTPTAQAQPGSYMLSLPAAGEPGSMPDSQVDAARVAVTSVTPADALAIAREVQRPVTRQPASQKHPGRTENAESATGSLLGKRSPAECLQVARKRYRTELHMELLPNTSPEAPPVGTFPHGQAARIAADMPSLSEQLGAGSWSMPEISVPNGVEPAGATPDVHGLQRCNAAQPHDPTAASGLWGAGRQPGVAAEPRPTSPAPAGMQTLKFNWNGAQQLCWRAIADAAEVSLRPPVAARAFVLKGYWQAKSIQGATDPKSRFLT